MDLNNKSPPDKTPDWVIERYSQYMDLNNKSPPDKTPDWVIARQRQYMNQNTNKEDDLTEGASTAIGNAMKSRALTDPDLTLKQRTDLYRGGSALETVGSIRK